MNKRNLTVFVVGIAGVGLGLLLNAGCTERATAERGETVATTRQKSDDEVLEKLRRDHKRLADALVRLAKTNPPIGTVTAFAGKWNKDKEDELGWILCDGRPLTDSKYEELATALDNATSAPNYQGYFLRGQAGEVDTPDKGRVLGSKQDDSTKMPVNAFKTNRTGGHTHPVSVRQNDGDNDQSGNEITTHNKYWKGDGKAEEGMKTSGEHEHTILGGDPETRPINKSVNWIIKFR